MKQIPKEVFLGQLKDTGHRGHSPGAWLGKSINEIEVIVNLDLIKQQKRRESSCKSTKGACSQQRS
jgi:hypothetical protein